MLDNFCQLIVFPLCLLYTVLFCSPMKLVGFRKLDKKKTVPSLPQNQKFLHDIVILMALQNKKLLMLLLLLPLVGLFAKDVLAFSWSLIFMIWNIKVIECLQSRHRHINQVNFFLCDFWWDWNWWAIREGDSRQIKHMLEFETATNCRKLSCRNYYDLF